MKKQKEEIRKFTKRSKRKMNEKTERRNTKRNKKRYISMCAVALRKMVLSFQIDLFELSPFIKFSIKNGNLVTST